MFLKKNWEKFERLYSGADYLTRHRAKHLLIFNCIMFVSAVIILAVSFPIIRPGFSIVIVSSVVGIYFLLRNNYSYALNITLSCCVLAITVGMFYGFKSDSRSYTIACVILLFLYFSDIKKTIFVSLYCLFLLLVESILAFLKGNFQAVIVADRIILHSIFSIIAILIVRLLYGNIKEKDDLIKEIHHRVRNNMQVLSGLVELHRMEDSEAAGKLFEEFQRRILSISEVQNAIYKAENYNEIDFAEVANVILSQLLAKTNVSNIRIESKIDKVQLRIESAIPFAMIFSELVSNALVHGSKQKYSPEVFISFEKKNGMHTLKIRDSGNGIEDWMTWSQPKTVGFTLVKILTQQLKGTVNIHNEQGTCALVEF